MISLAGFEGRWRLLRQIEDRRAGVKGSLQGHAVWSPDGTGLTQEETGLLRYGDAPPMQAGRRYLWREVGGVLMVYFDDGRPFHSVVPDTPEASHFCDPDTYRVTYDFDAWPEWSSVWEVHGPRKNARITSRFSPLAPES